MNNPIGAGMLAPAPEHARDLQARLYREIGISAVAAALRFTTQPDPAPRSAATTGVSHDGRKTVAA